MSPGGAAPATSRKVLAISSMLTSSPLTEPGRTTPGYRINSGGRNDGSYIHILLKKPCSPLKNPLSDV